MPELIPAEPGSPEWLAARRAGVTATHIGTILGLNPRDSAYSLYWRKLGQVPEVEDNDRSRLGRELEPYVELRWIEATGRSAHKGALWRHDSRTWQMATLDRAALGDSAIGQLEPVELKTWADADRHAWEDGPPARVRAQVLWQMDVMDVSTGHVGVVFLPSGEFRSYVIEHDQRCGHDHEDICSVCNDLELMREAGEEFMARLRLELPAPDPDASAATLAAVRARFTRQPDKQAEIDARAFQQWTDFKNAEKINADNACRFEIQLREQAGEASVLTVDGQPVARRYVMDQQVKAHTRHMDYLKRIKQEESDQ